MLVLSFVRSFVDCGFDFCMMHDQYNGECHSEDSVENIKERSLFIKRWSHNVKALDIKQQFIYINIVNDQRRNIFMVFFVSILIILFLSGIDALYTHIRPKPKCNYRISFILIQLCDINSSSFRIHSILLKNFVFNYRLPVDMLNCWWMTDRI